jgi:hypothetical protein
VLRQRAGTMSGGQRQRLALAAATLHRPELLLLDEPTSAVDPQSRRDFWESLFGLVQRGTTILVSTHYMDEAERCHRLAILDEGRLVAEGSPRQLMRDIAAAVVEIETDDVPRRAARWLAIPQIRSIAQLGTRLHALLDRDMPDAAATCAAPRGGRRRRRGATRAGEPRGRVRRATGFRHDRPPAGDALSGAVLAAHRCGDGQGGAAARPRPAHLRHDRRHPADADAAVRLRDQLRRARPACRRRRRGRHQPVARIVAALEASGVVEFAAPSAGIPDLQRRMQAGDISVGIHIPRDFERRVLDRTRPAAQLLVDGSEPMVDSVARGLAAVPLPRRDGLYGGPCRCSSCAPSTTPSGAPRCRSCPR